MGTKKRQTKQRPGDKQNATYRVVVKQPISVDIAPDAKVTELSIQGIACRIAVEPLHQDPVQQRENGGSWLTVEFQGDIDDDLVLSAKKGFELIEDFISAIAVIEGITFAPSVLIQGSRTTASKKDNCEFVQFIRVPITHWNKPITAKTIAATKHMLEHWDGLENGHRLRRAARQYREAIGNLDEVLAFQEAYIGLETLEIPLAKMAGKDPGVEVVKGHCEKCKAEFTRKKTSLVGVKHFILRPSLSGATDQTRELDWKLINRLRNDLMHGLVDMPSLGRRPDDALAAGMHYLHDAICVCSHLPELASPGYRIARGGQTYALYGIYTKTTRTLATPSGDLIRTSDIKWQHHSQYGYVPEISIRHEGMEGLRMGVQRLVGPISSAMKGSFTQANIETDMKEAE